MTFGSVFAGVGGFDLGFEWAGLVCKWQIENDPYCLRVLAKHWPDVRRYGDVREVRGSELESVDVLCGGFPCQDISDAGKRAGITGARSGLWSEMCRLVREVRPRFVVVENVSALLGRGMGVVLGDLAACGYDAEWDCIPAAAVGAPHRRDRVFIIAYPSSSGMDIEHRRFSGASGQGAVFVDRNGTVRNVADANGCRQQEFPQYNRESTKDASDRKTFGCHADRCYGSAWWKTEPNVGRVADGVPHRVDRLRALGNAVVPQVAEWLGRRLMEHSA